MSAGTPLELLVRREPGATVITACGEIDLSSSRRLRERVLACLEQGVTALDLAGVAFCDSAGLKVLVEAERVARACGTAFRLAAVSRPVARVIELAGAVEVLAVFPDVEAAVKE